MSRHPPIGADSTREEAMDLKPRKSTKRSKRTAEPSESITNTTEATVNVTPVEDEPSLEDRLKEKARKKQARVRVAKVVEGEVPEAPKKSKKRKHQSGENVDQSQGEDLSKSENDHIPEEPPKKKHKNRTEFSDPRVDATLNNQSRKALEYVFTLMNRPSKWKFNKARQNWVIRNVWASDAISDIYFPLVVKYLNTVQGGSREKLKETCESYLKIQESSDMNEDPTNKALAPKALPTTVETLAGTKPTPGPLIASNPTPNSTNTDTTTPLITPTTTPALVEFRRTRARILLDTLTKTS
ncbi:hypothetical protein M413DRAFT_295420 [Hebeloma cylindrosporum]|uniref:WKF domain-containing protein n=1 Tax=Hebeloma cylindrosporum TaxID=76867 RepID=A0A0C2YY13_HEBCY|nr:hypothetical protein M413DRAFT_295420 [Hebeloma cylindrosporum h7]